MLMVPGAGGCSAAFKAERMAEQIAYLLRDDPGGGGPVSAGVQLSAGYVTCQAPAIEAGAGQLQPSMI
eukprot:SAG22_NODE_21032_length_260_cov_0.968944_1_plen_68_part_00